MHPTDVLPIHLDFAIVLPCPFMPPLFLPGPWANRVHAEGSIPEREPEKRLPHPRKAAGAQITQSRHWEVVTINTNLGLFWVPKFE